MTVEGDRYCKSCGAKMQGGTIPEEHRHLYGGNSYWSNWRGIEFRGMYDGVLLWQCPECEDLFPRKGLEHKFDEALAIMERVEEPNG